MITEHPHGSREAAAAYDETLDRAVDTRGISYDDARRELGDPPYELYEQEPAAATRPMGSAAIRKGAANRPRRRRSGHGPQFGEEEGVGYPGGEPPYFQRFVPLSDEQQERNRRGAAAVREGLKRQQDGS